MTFKVFDSAGEIIFIERDEEYAKHRAHQASTIMSVMAWADLDYVDGKWQLTNASGSVIEVVAVARASILDRLRWLFKQVFS